MSPSRFVCLVRRWLAIAALALAPAPALAIVTIAALPLPDSTEQVEVDGHIAWVLSAPAGCFGCPETLRAIDLSEPTEPVEIGSTSVPPSNALVLGADRAFLTGARLRVVDISDPTAPAVVPVQNYPSATGLQVVGNLAYLAAGSSAFRIHDVSGVFGAPQLSSLSIPANNVALRGTTAYVVGAGRFSVVDVSSPTAPRVVGELGIGPHPWTLELDGDRVYVVESNPPGIRMIDVSDSAAPSELGYLERERTVTAALAGGDLLYLAAESLSAVDVSDPARPAERGGASKAPSTFADAAHLGDSLVAAAAGASGLLVIDVSDPDFPRELGAFQDDSVFVRDVAVVGTRAYVVGETLDVVDVTAPGRPTLLARVPLPEPGLDLEVRDDIAFVADASGMSTYRLREGREPKHLDRVETEGAVRDLELAGRRAYLSGNEIRVVDVSRPEALRGLFRGAPAHDLEVGLGSLFALQFFGGVYVFDLSKPDFSREYGFLADGFARRVEISGELAWTASRSAAGSFLEAWKTGEPVPAHEIRLFGEALDLEVAGERLYVAEHFDSCSEGGALVVVDATELAPDFQLGARCVPGGPIGVDVANGLAYVAAGAGGLRILDFGPQYAAGTRSVAIDVQPRRRGWRLDPFSSKRVEVAILGSEEFDVTRIRSVFLGPAQASPARAVGYADADGDGFTDLVASFQPRATGIGRTDDLLCASGTLLDGSGFEGCDSRSAARKRAREASRIH